MTKRMIRWSLAVAAVISLAVGAIVWAQGGRPLSTTLTGAAEIPPGDPDGTGTAQITLNAGLGEVCWTINVASITLPATAAHIHIAPAGIAGPIVVTLSAPDASGVASGCTQSASQDVLRGITVAPELFYVNVHNADFPAGAVRGQLSTQP